MIEPHVGPSGLAAGLGRAKARPYNFVRWSSRLRRGRGCDGIETGEIDDDGLGTATNDDPGDGFGGGINFLMGKVGGYENEVAGTHGFGTFAIAAPADLSSAAKHVNDGFLLAMVVHRARRMWLGDHHAATEMRRAGKIAVDGGEA